MGHPSCSPLSYHFNRNWKQRGIQHLPLITLSLNDQIEKLKSAYQQLTEGKFSNAIENFKKILVTVPIVVASSDEQTELKEIINICKEYILGLGLELERKVTESVERQLELAVYFSYCDFQPGHQKLSIKQAMKLCANHKNYGTAYILASKLLQFSLSQQDEQLVCF